MPDDRLSGLLRELHEVLEEERGMLLSGRPQRVVRAVERKLQLAAEIESAWARTGIARPDRETVLRLDSLNRGNAVICSAVLRHLTRTLDRLRRGDSHRSYRPDGGEAQPPAPGRLGAA
jgi:flagellar biosynthesis/type III secretory pathway chaperone